MKPRFQVASLTDEDYEIFLERWSVRDNGRFFRACRHADRHDADLMFCWLAAPENSPRYWTLYYLSGRHLE